MRLLALLLVVAVAAACGSNGGDGSPRTATGDARDDGAPTLDIDGPPPAWVETERGRLWLAYATYCWRTACADYVPPVCGDERHAPTIVVRRGEIVRFHLGFEPEGRVALRFFKGRRDVRELHLPSDSTPTWEVQRGGPFWIDATAKAGSGSASYSGCFKLESV